MTFLFWTLVIATTAWLCTLTFMWVNTKADTTDNTHRIGKLEISVEDLWAVYHKSNKDE